MGNNLRNKTRIICSFVIFGTMLIGAYVNNNIKTNQEDSSMPKQPFQNILDGCYHVYIDVGTNIGIQIRKLFEPEKFPGANVHPIFNSKFGNATERLQLTQDGGSMVCAIGVEPNSHHTRSLKEVESIYTKCGWRVIIMTETAASDRPGIGRFYTDESYENMEWGGGILPPDINAIAVENQKNVTIPKFKNVALLRLSDFLKNIVGTRKLPKPKYLSISPNVVMKMDIEGSEVSVIPDMLFTGGFQYINNSSNL